MSPHIHTPHGRGFDTKDIPPQLEPTFCKHCGERLGWIDIGYTDVPVMTCDSCLESYIEDNA